MIVIAVILVVVVVFLALSIVAVLYLTGGQTYPVPVAAMDIPANQRITENMVRTEEFEEEPPANALRESGEVVGQVAANPIRKDSPFTPPDLRENHRVLRTTDSVPPGNRLQENMIREGEAEEMPDGAITNVDQLLGKMVREGIPANTVITRSQVHLQEQDFVVATREIPSNSLIRDDQIRVEQRPTGPNDGISDMETVLGRATKTKLEPGDPVRQSDLFSEDIQLSYFIPIYRRAVTMPVSNYNNVSYMLRPGDQVDLYAYMPQGFQEGTVSGQSDVLSTNMLQKVADGAEVLTLNDVFRKEQIQQIESGENAQKFTYQKMTLGVSLWEAEKVNLIRGMQESGEQNVRFMVILRPRQLDSERARRRVTNYDLISPELGRNADQRVEGRNVEVIQGEEQQTYQVPRHR